jgi:hypothetical protein
MKIRPVGAELFYAEGRAARRADIYEEAVTFRNFANAPNNCRMWKILTVWVE